MPKTGLDMQSPPEVILFDVGNTLLFPNWPRILAPLRARGVWPGAIELQAIERKTKRQFDQEMVKGQGKVDHSFWERFYTYLLNFVGLPDADFRQKLIQATHNSENWDTDKPDE